MRDSLRLGDYRAILFDLNETLMFGGDRLGDDEDFHRTYRRLGGGQLGPEEVQEHLLTCRDAMARDYDDPNRYDDFPSLAEAFSRYTAAPPSEHHLLVATFSHHELGSVPVEVVDTLRRLAEGHRLGLVSNIWSPKEPWVRELERSGLGAYLSTSVYSSDGRSIKPSTQPIRQALDALETGAPDALFVGDSLERDIEPARRLGMATVWIHGASASPLPDWTVPSVVDLLPFSSDRPEPR